MRTATFIRILRISRMSLLTMALLVGTVQASSLVGVATASAKVGDPFAVGRSLVSPKTLKLRGLEQYMQAVGDGVTQKAILKYGDFSKYWEETAKSRSGKAFEAIVASFENRRLARMGDAKRLVATAAEGDRAHPADLLLRAGNSTITKQYQLKLNAKVGMNALMKKKYAGMTVLLPRDQMKFLAKKLADAEAKAARRGLPLVSKWRAVKEAIDEGRLTSSLPSGATTPTRQWILNKTRVYTKKLWNKTSERTTNLIMRETGAVGKWMGRGVLVLDVAEAGHTT